MKYISTFISHFLTLQPLLEGFPLGLITEEHPGHEELLAIDQSQGLQSGYL